MTIELQFKIKNDPNLYRYLRENSYWYKELNRNSLAIKEMERKMKSQYKISTQDKIKQLVHGIEMVRTFMDIINWKFFLFFIFFDMIKMEWLHGNLFRKVRQNM